MALGCPVSHKHTAPYFRAPDTLASRVSLTRPSLSPCSREIIQDSNVKRPVTEFTRTPARPARIDRVQDFIARAARAVDDRPGPPVPEPDYHALIQHSSDMMFLLDAGGHIRFAGPSCTQILGYTPEELLGRSCFALIHPGELSLTARALTALLDEPGGTRK